MYHVISTGLTIIVLYLLSIFFYRSSIYSLQFHRKLWNSILATAFTLTAIAGIFLALQVTYKWDIPVIKTIVKWHVEIGIGLSVTGLFHLFWHTSYFTNMFKREDVSNITPVFEIKGHESEEVPVMLFITGFISSSVQLLLLKEIINITGGYELVAGAFLFSWLIGSSAGSALAPRSALSDIRKISLYFSIGPIISVIMMLLFSRLFMKPGETPSFLNSVIFTFLVLLPFCIISGFTFIKLVGLGKSRGMIPGKSFSIETAGGIIAGIIVSVLSSGILNTYQSLLLFVTLGLAYVIVTFYLSGKSFRLYFKVAVLAIAILIIVLSPDKIMRRALLRGIRVTETFDTPFGNITYGSYHDEVSTFYNQRLLLYNNDAVESEEDIHYAMLQAYQPDKVLLISGPINSRLNEIKKYHAKNVVYVERDPVLAFNQIEEQTEYPEFLRIENSDAMSFVKYTSEKFDVVIMLLPPPSSLSLNRFYTLEFFSQVRNKLNPDGVFSCSPGINTGYFNDESVKLYSSIYNSLKAVFKNVIPISGNKLYFIASDKQLTASVCQLVKDKGIKNVYVGPDYLSDDILLSKSNEITSLIDHSTKLNKLALPVACLYYQSYNLSKNLNEKIPLIVVFAVLFALSLKTLKSGNSIMYFGAFALAGYEIILLMMLQLTIGNMYQITGLIIAGLLAGLAVGAGTEIPLVKTKSYGIKALILISLYTGSALAAERIMSMKGHLAVSALLIIMGFLPSVITGSFFRDLTSVKTANMELAGVYSADLAGSAMGFIIFSGLAVPIIGIRSSLLVLPIMIIAGFLLFMTGKKQ